MTACLFPILVFQITLGGVQLAVWSFWCLETWKHRAGQIFCAQTSKFACTIRSLVCKASRHFLIDVVLAIQIDLPNPN